MPESRLSQRRLRRRLEHLVLESEIFKKWWGHYVKGYRSQLKGVPTGEIWGEIKCDNEM